MRLRFAPRSEFDRVRTLTDPRSRAALFADLARLNTLYMIARAGSGHIGSSFSSLDIVSWLLLEELDLEPLADGLARDLFFSSKGHDAPGLYAALTALGVLPFELLHRLRRRGGLPGHPDVSTPGVVTNTGSLGMGISKAKGLALSRRLHGERSRIVVMTGDGELQEGQIWESLQSAATRGLTEITVVVDHNKLQSDTFVERTSPLGDLEAKFRAFSWDVVRCDGHDFAALEQAFADRPEAAAPRAIVADTIKGRGVSFMEPSALESEDALYGFHSGAPSPEHYERGVAELTERIDRALREAGLDPLTLEEVEIADRAPADGERLVAAYSDALVEQGKRRGDVVVLDGDLALDCGVLPFRDAFPERYFECGIAEQDMVSLAGGLARGGHLPVVHSFACFLSTRPNEQIYNNATEHTKIVYVGSLAGLIPAGPGHSHQSVRDIACLAGTPGLTLVEPSCEAEVGALLDWAVQAQGSTYLRLVSVPCEVPYRLPVDYRPSAGRGVELRAGSRALVVGYGPILLAEAWRAAEQLEREGISVRLVNLPWLNRIDEQWLAEAVDGVESVVTLDNHYVEGGQGERIAARLAGLGLSCRVRHLGLEAIPECGTPREALEAHHLDDRSIAEAVRTSLSSRVTRSS